MVPTVASYLESVSNPEGRFKTLARLHPHCDPEGRVLFTVHSHTVNFPVMWQERECTLKCFLTQVPEAKERARLVAARLGAMNAPFACGYEYLVAEMAVFDSVGRGSWQDVVLQQIPEGRSLHRLLTECCDRAQGAPVQEVLEGVARMAAWLSQQGIAHRNIKPSNLHVAHGNRPVLLNFDFAQLAGADSGAASQEDSLALARISLVLFVLTCDPTLYRRLRQQLAFSREDAARIAGIIAANGASPRPLRTLARTILSGQADRAELNTLLAELAATPALPRLLAPDIYVITTPGQSPATAPETSGQGSYPEVGEQSESMTLVKDVDGLWLYLDRKGRPVTGQRYDYAETFAEGRAVVARDGHSALIDHDGQQLIPMQCDSVLWDEDAGVASAELDGMWALYDRNGTQLTPYTYEWLSLWCEGLLLARKQDRYGFLDRNGKEAIGFQYDQASSFSSGRAPVRHGTEEFWIDSRGNRIH